MNFVLYITDSTLRNKEQSIVDRIREQERIIANAQTEIQKSPIFQQMQQTVKAAQDAMLGLEKELETLRTEAMDQDKCLARVARESGLVVPAGVVDASGRTVN